MPFDPQKRAAACELDVALYFLLHDTKELVPLLKEAYKEKWSGFIDDILEGTPPYEQASALIGIFLRSSFEGSIREARDQIVASIVDKDFVQPPNLLRIVGQVCYHLYLLEQEKEVREKYGTAWINDMARMFADAGSVSFDDCTTYLLSLAKSYRDAKHEVDRAFS
jgi:hypothetical protein